MLSKSFKPAKCKTSLKLAVARIKLLRNKREVQVKQMKRELAQLIENGQEQTARIRVEHVIREEKTMSAYELIELYCELIVARLPIIESQKSCPIDLKEAVSSVIFASPRCSDVPELMDIRKHFTTKYGKEFINAALEVRPDCGVSRLVVEKLSARAPDIGSKVKTLTAVAEEHNLKWDPKAFEEQLQKPHDDLLNGPSSFASASDMLRESSSVKSSPAPSQTNESSMRKMPATTSQPTIPGPSVPLTSRSESRPSERRFEDRDTSNSYDNREKHASLNRSAWNMGFQDATSAAHAAAESAERASMAARAAAELATQESMSRQNSSGSIRSPRYTTKYDRPEQLRVILDEHITDEPVPKGNYESRDSPGKNMQQDERTQGISRREEAARTADNDYQDRRKAPIRSSLGSGRSRVDDDILDTDVHKDDRKDHGHVQRISSKSEAREHNHRNVQYYNVGSSRENTNVSSSHRVTDDEKLWNSNIYAHEYDEDKTLDARGDIFASTRKPSASSDSYNLVFDNYGSDAEEDNTVFGRNGGNLLDSYQVEEPSGYQSTKAHQNRSGSFTKNKGSQLHFFTETQPEMKLAFPSQYKDVVPAFDSSDGEDTKYEEEVANSSHKVAKTPSNVLYDHWSSAKSSYSGESTHESINMHMGERKEFRAYEKSTGTGRPSPSSDKAPSNSNVSAPDYSSSDEEPPPLPLTRRQPTREVESKETLMHLGSKSSEISNESNDESELGLNFGKLTGGFKQRGFPRPPYVRASATDPARSSTQSLDSIPKPEKPIPDLDKWSASVEVADKERYNGASRLTSYATKSRTSDAPIDSPSGTSEGLAARYSVEGTSNLDDGHFAARKSKIIGDAGATPQEPYHQRSQRKSHKEVSPNFQGAYDDPAITEQSRDAIDSRDYRNSASTPRKQNSDASPSIEKLISLLSDDIYASSEDVNLEPYDQKRRLKADKDSSSRITNLDSSEAILDSKYTGGSRDKLSRRTRDVSSESKHSSSRVTEPLPNTNQDAVQIQNKRNPKLMQSNPSVEQPSVASKRDEGPIDDAPGSNGESVSRENSLKKAAHIHPKLPDYESLAAHFQSLRSNRR